jgi:hypothetical protein
MDLINLDEKFEKEEVRKFESALYGETNLFFKGGETVGSIYGGKIEFLSLPNNKEEFENDVEKIYFQLARYAKNTRLAIEKFTNELYEKITFASFGEKELPIKRKEEDLISIAKRLNETIIPPWNIQEAYEEKKKSNIKPSYKALALGLVAGFFGGVGLALAYHLQQKPKVETKIETVTQTIVKTETVTIPKTETKTQTIIKNATTTLTTTKNQTIWGIDLFGNFSQDVLASYYVRDLKGKTYRFDPQKAGEIGRKFYTEHNDIIPKNASEFSKIKDDLIVYALSPELYSKIKDVTPENKTIQKAIVNGFLSDKILTPDEKDQIKFLASFPKEEILKLIGNGSYVNTDMDNDGMNNYFEKEIAGLPWNVYNGRYALILYTGNATGILTHADLRKFLIEDMKFSPQNVVYLQGSNATFENFKNAILQWENKVNKSDIVYISLFGHGDVGIFQFGDKKIVRYEEIDKYIDKLKPMKMLVVINACKVWSAVEPLKEGPSPRIVFTQDDIYFTQISRRFPRGFYAPEPEAFDLDGNGYASLAEIFKVIDDIMVKYGGDRPIISDPYNLAQTFYLGDLRVREEG